MIYTILCRYITVFFSIVVIGKVIVYYKGNLLRK